MALHAPLRVENDEVDELRSFCKCTRNERMQAELRIARQERACRGERQAATFRSQACRQLSRQRFTLVSCDGPYGDGEDDRRHQRDGEAQLNTETLHETWAARHGVPPICSTSSFSSSMRTRYRRAFSFDGSISSTRRQRSSACSYSPRP